MEPMRGSVGIAPQCLPLAVGMFGAVQVILACLHNRDPKPVWAGCIIVWVSDSDKMPLIIPS